MKNKGITLIALIITIIIMLILISVTVNYGIKSDLLGKAKEGTANYKIKEEEDEIGELRLAYKVDKETGKTKDTLGQYLAKELEGKAIVSSENGEITVTYIEDTKKTNIIKEEKNYISKDEEKIKKDLGMDKGYVGYYADLNGDGKITKADDGIIYADLAVGVEGYYSASFYKYDKIENPNSLKEYYVCQEEYDGQFGKAPVLSADGSGNDRFYVLALENYNKEIKYSWYTSAYDKLTDSIEFEDNDFGEGKNNTKKMISLWNSGTFAPKNGDGTYLDLWAIFKDDRNKEGTVDSNKWFIPSKGEWSAFGNNLGITKENYTDKELDKCFWSSSVRGKGSAFAAEFYNGSMNPPMVKMNYDHIRLSTTF